MQNMIDEAIKTLIEKRVTEAKERLLEKIIDGFKTDPNAKSFPPEEYIRIYHKRR